MQLETKRLLLRPFVPEDAEALFSYLHNPSVHCFMDMKLDSLKDAQKAVQERILDNNIPCQKLSEKLGMRQEGLFKEFVSFINDSEGMPIYENTYQYAILKKEWERQ